ncbi:EboA domain-containing protein [Bremerella cremea]|uniref:EboA domain-containing protein n=1 Tax=Bremerella cremea TaxID=1031537 RepID=UPI0031E9C90F
MSYTPIQLLENWILRQASDAGQEWLDAQRQAVAQGDMKALYMGFGFAPRKVGKADLQLTERDLNDAAEAREGWMPHTWTIDQAARVLLLTSLPSEDDAAYFATIEKLFQTAEIREQICLYQALQLLPHQELFDDRLAEGIRTNIKSVFESIAHNNPLPMELMQEPAWNQMVLKALFIGAALDPIEGLDRRVNPELARMLIDFAHERRAAKRPIPVELWRVAAPFADEIALEDMRALYASGEQLEQSAIALALVSSASDEADVILKTHPEIAARAERGEITWRTIAEEAY